MTDIPTLQTSRLRLRAHRPGDLAACAAMWGDPAVTKYIAARPFTREEVWARMLRYVGHWQWLGFGFWLMEDRASGRFIGEIGLADFKRDLEPPLPAGPEAGWVLVSEAHGKGLATEALAAVTAWHDANLASFNLACLIHPDNLASLRVAAKCGFQARREVLYKGESTAVLVRRSHSSE